MASETGRGTKLVVAVVAAIVGVGLWFWLRGGAEVAEPEVAGAPEEPGQAVVLSEPRGRPALVLGPRFGDRASIAGLIKDPQGQGVAGAQVCASAESERLPSSDTRRPTCVTSERDGHYRIEGLFAVRHRVTASAPGYVPGIFSRGEGASRREWIDLRANMEALEVDIGLEDGGVEIHGSVKDLSGGAVEGALVMAERSYADTGAEGEFSMWVRPGRVWLQAQAEGYASGHDDGAAPGHVFEVFLTPEAVLVGKVVRAGEGSPVEGARVTAQAGSFNWSDSSAFTDAGGNFRLDGLEPGAYKARAESDEVLGLAAEQVILGLGETSAPIVIEAHPAFFVEGTIASEDGASCERGDVSLSDRAQGRNAWGQPEADGVVRMRGMLPGEYKVEVSCEGYVSAERYERVTVVDKSVSGVKWTVTSGQAIRGVVVDGGGKPVARVQVSASAKPDPSQPRAQQTSSWGGETDAQGRFELKGLLAGDYELSLYTWNEPRATPPKPTAVTLPRGQDVEGLRIELPATGEVRGVVRDPKGQAVAKAAVSLNGVTSQYASAADDGSFHFAHVGAGEYRVMARIGGETMRAPGTGDDDVQGEKIEVRSGKTETVKLVVEGASGRITGVVRDEDGGPVADAFVESSRESDSAAVSAGRAMRRARWSRFWEKPHLTDADGRFTLDALAPGKHTIRAHRQGGGEANLEHVEVGGDVVLMIASAGKMSGTVSVRGGEAPPEFSVQIVDESTGYQRRDSFFRTRGAWSLADVPAGKYKVNVSAGGGTAEVEASMSAGKDTSGVRIELTPKVTVRGKVVDLEGQPVSGMQVGVSAPGSWGGGGDEDKLNVTDESGRYEVGNAPTGAVQVSVYPRSWGGDGEYESTRVPAKISGGEATVELAPIQVARRRVKDGEVQGDLGYKIKEAEPGADPMAARLIVAFVRPGGPAAAAGLKVGDEIASVDGQDVTGANVHLHGSLTRVLEGTAVALGLVGGGNLQVTAGKRP